MLYGKPVILLIDEYDVPLAKASEYGYYREMLDVIRPIMSFSLKTNVFLQFAVVTGCLRIAKESIFTGTNHFKTNSIAGNRYTDCFGFTVDEVDQLLADAGFLSRRETVKHWYDGYRFGEQDMYCPWDVLNYVSDLEKNPDVLPANYWKDTGQQEFGYSPEAASEEDFWSILYLAGYLTAAKPGEDFGKPEPGEIYLKIPNEEVKTIFQDTIVEWFRKSVKSWDKKALFSAVWNGDDDRKYAEEFADEYDRVLCFGIAFFRKQCRVLFKQI